MTAAGPSASAISISETLVVLDGAFQAVARGVASNQYALWLGSGISRERMPPTKGLVLRVLGHLQQLCDPTDSDCRFRHSLDAIISLAKPSPAEQEEIDYSTSPLNWKCGEAIAERLTLNYARMLDMPPDGEDLDYLVWTALDVGGVYGDQSIKPDVEHLAVAALAVEGVASDIASANWDGLVEQAVVELTGADTALRVVVQQADLRRAPSQSTLYKFHGCAILASSDPDNYREHIVGRASQINGFAALNQNPAVKNRLTDIATTKPTLMMGLSAQDANIQGVFAQAAANMKWPWPHDPPACVFAEDQLGADQVGLLQNVYNAAFATSTSSAIKASAHLRAFGRSLLPALWCEVLRRKLNEMAKRKTAVPAVERAKLEAGLTELRNRAAAACLPGQQEAFFRAALFTVRRALSLFRRAEEPSVDGPLYESLTPADSSGIATDHSLLNTGLPELAAGLGLFGFRASQGGWDIVVSNPRSAKPGALRVVTADTSAEIFFAANAEVSNKMFRDGIVADDDPAVLVHSHAIPERYTRSPRVALGRDGSARLREVSISALLAETQIVADVIDRLREEVAL